MLGGDDAVPRDVDEVRGRGDRERDRERQLQRPAFGVSPAIVAVGARAGIDDGARQARIGLGRDGGPFRRAWIGTCPSPETTDIIGPAVMACWSARPVAR